MKMLSFRAQTSGKSLIEQLQKNRVNNALTQTKQLSDDAFCRENEEKKKKYIKFPLAVLGSAALIAIVIKRKNIAKFFGFNRSKIDKPQIITPIPAPQKSISAPVQEAPEPPVLKKEELQKIIERGSFEKYYLKLDGEKSRKEVCASKLYELLDVKVAKMDLLGDFYETKGVKSAFIENLQRIKPENTAAIKEISQNFGADVLLSNKNILNSCRLDEKNNVIRVNLIDTLGVRRDGTPEYFGAVVNEVAEFFNPRIYPENASVYSSMTREDLIKTLKKVTSIKISDDIKGLQVLRNNGEVLNGLKYKDKLHSRISFLRKVINIAEKIEQGSMPIAEYAEKIKNEAIKETISSANHFSTLKNIEYSIGRIENKEVQAELTNLLKQRIKTLTSQENKKMTQYEIGELLEKYIAHPYEPTSEERGNLVSKFGKDYANQYLTRLKTTINYDKINNLMRVINKNDGKYVDFWRNNPDKMAVYINSETVSANQLMNFDDTAWDVVIGQFKTLFERPINKDILDSINLYSGLSGYDQINGMLRFNYQAQRILDSINEKALPVDSEITRLKTEINSLKQITCRFYMGKTLEDKRSNFEVISNKISNLDSCLKNGANTEEFKVELTKLKEFINKIFTENGYNKQISDMEAIAVHSTPETQTLKLVRNETSDCFEQFMLGNEKLSELMLKVMENPELKSKILDYFNKSQPALYCPSFISTSIFPYETLAGNVKWYLRLGKDVKYAYISDLTHLFHHRSSDTEAELLVFPGHKINIKSADYRDSKWRIKGEIVPERES